MKAKIFILPKTEVVDPQGLAVKNALDYLGYKQIDKVRIGKYIGIELKKDTDPRLAEIELNTATHKVLSNPSIEDFKIEFDLWLQKKKRLYYY